MMMQEDIEAARGKRVEGDQNFKRAEELMYGKAHYDLEQLEKVVTRLKETMKSKDVKIEDLNDFMYARHAAGKETPCSRRETGWTMALVLPIKKRQVFWLHSLRKRQQPLRRLLLS